MEKHFKRVLPLLLACALLAMVLGACSPAEDTTSGADTTAAGGTQPATTANTDAYPITPEELGSGTVKWSETDTPDGWTQVTNEGGSTLGYTKGSGVNLIQVEGLAFKDMNADGFLNAYEDWRLDAETRALDLASVLTVEEAAGLMIHGNVSNVEDDASGEVRPLLEQNARVILSHATSFPVETQAKWNNAMQTFVEGIGNSIPVNISTNPRTSPTWPDNLGQAATFDPDFVFNLSKNISQEYRAIGVTTLLGPQIDLASEPRWSRIPGTFGEDPALSRDMTAASVAGHQSTFDANGNDLGWGLDSVNAMIKHFPGDGTGEGGRESHDAYGQFTVYPGGQFETSLIPFFDGGLHVDSKSGPAASVMDSYAIAFSEDEEYGALVGSAFSSFKNGILHDNGFDGYICSDWGVVGMAMMDTGWGMQDKTDAERCYAAFMAGTDQIGGIDGVQALLDGFQIGVAEQGEDAMLARYRESARKILKTIFQVGLFENAYVDVSFAKSFVGGEEMAAAGYEAQLKSVVMLKNDGVLSAASTSAEKPTVYVPMDYSPFQSLYGGYMIIPASASLPIDRAILDQYFNVVTDTLASPLTGEPGDDGNPTPMYEDIIRATPEELAECDYALVIVKSPANVAAGILSAGFDAVTGQYIPISLQYGPYTANSSSVRTESISGPMVETEVSNAYGTQKVMQKQNTSYYGNSAQITNAAELDKILLAVSNMPESAKIIVAIDASNPIIVSEFEKDVDVILAGFGGTNYQAYLDILTGKSEPSALLPIQFPKNMETVEAQFEDVPRDMECYVDSMGNTYDFAFGLNWSGVINDARVAKYNVPPLVSPATQLQ